MSECVQVLDQDTIRAGLLMESAQAQQTLAETHLEKLRVHTRGLDGVVREEIRRTLIEELRSLSADTHRAARALHALKRAADLRVLLWSAGIAILCTAIPSAIAHWMLPSAGELAALRQQRDALHASIVQLEQRGGRVQWRHCGEARRLCVRVDLKAPVYGATADYYILKSEGP